MRNKFITNEDSIGLIMYLTKYRNSEKINEYSYIKFKDFDNIFNTIPKGKTITKLLDADDNIIDSFVLESEKTEKDLKEYGDFLKKAFKFLRENYFDKRLKQERFYKNEKTEIIVKKARIENLFDFIEDE